MKEKKSYQSIRRVQDFIMRGHNYFNEKRKISQQEKGEKY